MFKTLNKIILFHQPIFLWLANLFHISTLGFWASAAFNLIITNLFRNLARQHRQSVPCLGLCIPLHNPSLKEMNLRIVSTRKYAHESTRVHGNKQKMFNKQAKQ